MAYGESGSGKSYTLNGPKQDAGIISRFVTDMFKRIDKEKGKGRGRRENSSHVLLWKFQCLKYTMKILSI